MSSAAKSDSSSEPENVLLAIAQAKERRRKDPMLVPMDVPPPTLRDPAAVAKSLRPADAVTLLASQDIATWKLCERAQRFVATHGESILAIADGSLPRSVRPFWDGRGKRMIYPPCAQRVVELVTLLGSMHGYGHPYYRAEVIELFDLFHRLPLAFPANIAEGFWTEVVAPAVAAAVTGELPPRPKVVQARDVAI